jgi:hypothetical protein
MEYIKVKWIHSLADEPVLLYSELDPERWEKRKVGVFADGHCGYASPTESVGSTRLGLDPVPSLAEIASDPQFEPVEITRREFEEAWALAHEDFTQRL